MYMFKIKPETHGEYFKFVMMTGLFCGLNAIGGHELIHKREWYNKALGTWAYTKFFYSHFLDEHIKGHHKNIATDEDPATARKGEIVYTFVVRSAIGSHLNVASMENKRVLKEHGEDVSMLKRVMYNKMTQYFCLHATILTLIYVFLGWQSVKHQIVYSLAGMFYTEHINYIEHYGLQRQKDQNGIYESVNRMCSWNSLSSAAFFRIQRHSDHHCQGYRPY